MMMPFAVALNNHLPAAAATAFVLYVFVRSAQQSTSLIWWLPAGMAAGLMAANELPALSMTALWCALLLICQRRALLPFLAGIAIVAAAFFVTNHWAHQSLRPPYMHRGDGTEITSVAPGSDNQLPKAAIARKLAERDLLDLSDADLQWEQTGDEGRWRLIVDENQLYAIVKTETHRFPNPGVGRLVRLPDQLLARRAPPGSGPRRAFEKGLRLEHAGRSLWNFFAHAHLVDHAPWLCQQMGKTKSILSHGGSCDWAGNDCLRRVLRDAT